MHEVCDYYVVFVKKCFKFVYRDEFIHYYIVFNIYLTAMNTVACWVIHR